MCRPQTASELMQFLQAANWLRTSLPRMAEVVEPLRVFLEQRKQVAEWVDVLPAAQWALNTSFSERCRNTPYSVMFGRATGTMSSALSTVTEGRYSSCLYNERQLIDITVVRRVRPRAEMPNRAPAAGGDYRWVVCCKKKGTYIQRTPPHIEKKKRKKKKRTKKKEVRSTGIELANFD